MIDSEKVIKGLQIERECVSRDCDRDCGKCDLVQDRDWLLSVYDDALALLKEQEAREQCLKTKCVICPHCNNCDVDENGLLKEQDAVEKDKECNEDKIAVECLNAIQTINKYIDDEEDEYGCTYWKDKKGYSFHADIGYFFEGLDNFEEYLMKRLGQKEKWE